MLIIFNGIKKLLFSRTSMHFYRAKHKRVKGRFEERSWGWSKAEAAVYVFEAEICVFCHSFLDLLEGGKD